MDQWPSDPTCYRYKNTKSNTVTVPLRFQFHRLTAPHLSKPWEPHFALSLFFLSSFSLAGRMAASWAEIVSPRGSPLARRPRRIKSKAWSTRTDVGPAFGMPSSKYQVQIYTKFIYAKALSANLLSILGYNIYLVVLTGELSWMKLCKNKYISGKNLQRSSSSFNLILYSVHTNVPQFVVSYTSMWQFDDINIG